MAVEDLTTYTKVDPGNYITALTAPKVTVVDVPSTGNDCYLYKDKGVDALNALNVPFEILTDDQVSYAFGTGGIGISNTVDDIFGSVATDLWCVTTSWTETQSRFGLYRGNVVASDVWLGTPGTLYYCTLSRASGNDTAILRIYSDSGRTTLVATLTVAGFGTTKWRYSFGFSSRNSGNADRLWGGYIQNLDLNMSAFLAAKLKRVHINKRAFSPQDIQKHYLLTK